MQPPIRQESPYDDKPAGAVRTPRRRHQERVSAMFPKLLTALAISLALLAALGCYNNNTGETRITDDIYFTLPAFPETGSNKVQIFTEMHYQPSFRSQEGPRLLTPDGAVPITGAEVVLTSTEEYARLPNPGGDASNGGALYAVNCAVCHGESLQGDGAITNFQTNVIPANLKEELTTNRPDGEIYGIISFGGNTAYATRVTALTNDSIDPNNCVSAGSCPMPEFRKLLTEAERWDLVAYLRQEQGR